MQLGDLLLAPLERDRLVLEPRREVARDHGDQQKQHEVDDVLRVSDPKSVERRIEEEIRSRRPRDGRDDSGPQSPLGRRDHDRQHVNEGNEIEGNEIVDDDKADGREPHKRKRCTERHRLASRETYPPFGVARETRGTVTFDFDRSQRPKILAFLKNRHLSCLSGAAQFSQTPCVHPAGINHSDLSVGRHRKSRRFLRGEKYKIHKLQKISSSFCIFFKRGKTHIDDSLGISRGAL